MKDLVRRNIIGTRVLLLFLITNSIYSIMLFVTIPMVTRFSGGMKLLDMSRSGYTPEYVNALLNTLGEQGRNAYLFRQIPVDMFYPLFSGVTYCLVIAYFLNRLGKLNSVLFYLCLLPYFPVSSTISKTSE